MPYTELLKKENNLQSEASLTTVDSNEIIARAVCEPKQYHSGKIQPNAFEQVNYEPMSVLRMQSKTFDTCLKKTIQQITKGEKKYVGYATVKVEDIRNLKHEDKRLFAVLDSGSNDKPSHADVIATKKVVKFTSLSGENLANFLVSKLFRVFSKTLNT